MNEPKYKSRSIDASIVDEMDTYAAEAAIKKGGTSAESTAQIIAQAWHYFKEHNYGA